MYMYIYIYKYIYVCMCVHKNIYFKIHIYTQEDTSRGQIIGMTRCIIKEIVIQPQIHRCKGWRQAQPRRRTCRQCAWKQKF